MQTRRAAKSRSRSNRAVAPARAADGGPARIPGFRIAHIGGRSAAVEEIRAYWQARGAVFLHHEPGVHPSRLEEVLERSHLVFHALTDANPEVGRSLERYCERRGKPLILLEADDMAALADALASSLPLG
jgi:hypothetical protein